jgi:hypothetical protein
LIWDDASGFLRKYVSASSNRFLWLAVSLAVSSCVAGVEGSEAWFLLGLQGEWFSDTAGLGDCGGDLACIVAALRYCVDYVAAL